MSKPKRNTKPSADADATLFYSEDGTPIRVDLPDGRGAIVDGEPRTLPKAMWRPALKAGCLTTGMAADVRKRTGIDDTQITDAEIPERRHKLILEAILDSARQDENTPGFETAFTQSGLPNVDWLSSTLGFKVGGDERDNAWVEAQAILDQEAGDGELTETL